MRPDQSRSTRLLWVAAAIAVLLAGCSFRPPVRSTPQPDVLPPQTSAKTRPYEVMGKRYYPITDATGYQERGVASWYGPKFDGRPTANGERFDMHQMTAAHKTLPLPTYVEVTNLRNGKRITVRVNDRGPFVDNRLIDLSYAAATELNLVGPGTGLVEIRAIAAPQTVATAESPQLEAFAAPAAVVPDPARQFFVQVGAFAVEDNARRLTGELERHEFAGVTSAHQVVNGQTVHRVRVGPVESVEQFDDLIARLTTLGYTDARLAVD